MTRRTFVEMLDRTNRLFTHGNVDKRIKEVKYDPDYSEAHFYIIANGYIGLKTHEPLLDTATYESRFFKPEYFDGYFKPFGNFLEYKISQDWIPLSRRKCDEIVRVDFNGHEPMYIRRAFVKYLEKSSGVCIGEKCFENPDGTWRFTETILCDFGGRGIVSVMPFRIPKDR